jgi:outer membrane receptor protein involved in Fe transport
LRKGRSLVVSGNITKGKDDRNVKLNSYNYYPILDIRDSILQSQQTLNNQLNYGAKINFTEPLGKGKYVEFNARHQEQNTDLDKAFYDINAITADELFNTALSQDYENIFKYDRAGLNFKISRSKYNVTLGTSAQNSELNGQVQQSAEPISKSFFNILPSARFDYRFSNSKRIRFNYNTRINAPSVEQLSPILDNSNPMQSYIGNPDLKAEYVHSLRLFQMAWSQFSFSSLFASVNGTYTLNKITNAVNFAILPAKKCP